MRRTVVASVLVLVVGTVAAGPTAVAGDLEHCESVASASRTCVEDTRSGDPGGAGADCDDYHGVTAASSAASSPAGDAAATAGGEERCRNHVERERVFAGAAASTDGAGEAGARGNWERRSTAPGSEDVLFADVDYASDAAHTRAEVEWSEFFGDPDIQYVVHGGAAGAVVLLGSSVPTDGNGPPAPPNPGWGDVLP